MKILVVEDTAEMRERIKDVLSKFEKISFIKEVISSDEAVDYVQTANPSLITLDIHIKGDSGIKTLKKIRNLGYTGKIIMLTNYNYPIYKAKCLEYGADYFLNKADEFEKLPMVVSDILREG